MLYNTMITEIVILDMIWSMMTSTSNIGTWKATIGEIRRNGYTSFSVPPLPFPSYCLAKGPDKGNFFFKLLVVTRLFLEIVSPVM